MASNTPNSFLQARRSLSTSVLPQGDLHFWPHPPPGKTGLSYLIESSLARPLGWLDAAFMTHSLNKLCFTQSVIHLEPHHHQGNKTQDKLETGGRIQSATARLKRSKVTAAVLSKKRSSRIQSVAQDWESPTPRKE